MSSIKERMNKLKEKSQCKTDADLLRAIYQYICEYEPKKVKGVKEDEFVKKTKGSFSAMIDGKRLFDPLYFYPMEKALNTSMVYILEGTGEKMEENEQRGIRYAAYTDTKGNYEKVISEGVYLEHDEYNSTLLDYMIEYKSGVGLEFFAARNELPLDEICQPAHGYYFDLSQQTYDDLIFAMLNICKPETMMKYLNGYYFVEKGFEPRFLTEDAKNSIETLSYWLFFNKDLREKLANYREFPLSMANPTLYVAKGQEVGNAAFVNFFFNQMLQVWHQDMVSAEEFDQLLGEILVKAVEINKAVMPAILKLNYQNYRIGDYGYVYSDGLVCGSIALATWRLEDAGRTFSQKTTDAYIALIDQLKEFEMRITSGSRLSVLNGEMRLAKHDNPAFYDFYQLMKEKGVTTVAQWLGETEHGKDHFRLPEGKQCALNIQGSKAQFEEALKILSDVDSLGEELLGEGKTFVFPNLSNRSFFIDYGDVTGFAPLDVEIGGRYDNLAELLAETVLAAPTFYSAGNTVAAVASALRTYGLTKKALSPAIRSMSDHYNQAASLINRDEERGKILIASIRQRALWLELFEKEIISQYK